MWLAIRLPGSFWAGCGDPSVGALVSVAWRLRCSLATAWRDLALDTDGDLLIDAGDFRLIQGSDAIVQECQTALGLWQGEYPFDTTVGTAWPTLLNVKGVRDSQITAEVRRVLSAVQGVASVDRMDIDRDTTARTASLTIYLTTDEAAVLVVPNVVIGGV